MNLKSPNRLESERAARIRVLGFEPDQLTPAEQFEVIEAHDKAAAPDPHPGSRKRPPYLLPL